MDYQEFVASKMILDNRQGFAAVDIHPLLKPHQRDIVAWACDGGLMTVPYNAVKMGRYGIGCELNPEYFRDGLSYLAAADREVKMPSLFDFERAAVNA